ncbi:hypothetical protein ACN47E_009112 [Coniothyrium glycines]
MRFFETLLSGAALVTAAFALQITSYPSSGVVAGRTYTIEYIPADNTPTTFILRQGASGNLNTIATLTNSATGGSFEWTPSTDLVNFPDYALQIRQDETINYSGQFPLTGGSELVSAVSSAASSAVASVASSVSAQISSIIASRASSAAASITPSASSNGTAISSATLSRSASGTSSASIPQQSTAGASSLASSPLAAVLAFAGFAYLV